MARPIVLYWPAQDKAALAALQSLAVDDVIALSQALGGAGNLVLNGSFVSNGVAYIANPPQPVTLTSTSDLSLVNFTITGTNGFGAVISEVLAGPNIGHVSSVNEFSTVTRIASSGAAADVEAGAWRLLNTGNNFGSANQYVFNGVSRTISLTAAGDESSANFIITGTLNGQEVTETLSGPNAETLEGTQLFDTIISIAADSDFTSVSVGTGLLGATHWVLHNFHATVLGMSVQVAVTGTVMNYSFQTTLDNVNLITPQMGVDLFTPITAMTGATTSQLAPYNNVTQYSRIAINEGTDDTGSLIATFIQQGID